MSGSVGKCRPLPALGQLVRTWCLWSCVVRKSPEERTLGVWLLKQQDSRFGCRVHEYENGRLSVLTFDMHSALGSSVFRRPVGSIGGLEVTALEVILKWKKNLSRVFEIFEGVEVFSLRDSWDCVQHSCAPPAKLTTLIAVQCEHWETMKKLFLP